MLKIKDKRANTVDPDETAHHDIVVFGALNVGGLL